MSLGPKASQAQGSCRRWACFDLVTATGPDLIGTDLDRYHDSGTLANNLNLLNKSLKFSGRNCCLEFERSPVCTRWFKYDRDYLCVNKSLFVPVIFEPPCTPKTLARSLAHFTIDP